VHQNIIIPSRQMLAVFKVEQARLLAPPPTTTTTPPSFLISNVDFVTPTRNINIPSSPALCARNWLETILRVSSNLDNCTTGDCKTILVHVRELKSEAVALWIRGNDVLGSPIIGSGYEFI
jgi:hypothetical protein